MSRFPSLGRRQRSPIDEDTERHISLLRIVTAVCATAVDAFQAAGSPIDAQLVAELEKTRDLASRELERLLANGSPREAPAPPGD